MAIKTTSLSSAVILDTIPQSVFTADFDGVVSYWNKASEKIFGYKNEEMLGKSIERVYSEEGKVQFRKDLERLREGKEVKGQWNCIKKDDSTLSISAYAKALTDEEGEFLAIVASVSDISDLKKVERELTVSEAKVEAVFKSAIDGIVTIGSDGGIRRFNEAASSMFGYSKDEAEGRNYRILLPEKERDSRDAYFKNIFQNDKAEFVGKRKELTGRKKDGTSFPIAVSISKVSWKNDEIYVAFINDISERRRLEQEILWISEDERQSIGQEMHDGLGQLLTGIGLITQTLARRLDNLGKPEAEEVREIADMIKEADEQARALSHGLVNVGVEEDGLQISLRRLCKQIKKLFSIECTLDVDYDIIINNNVTALNMYRIAQEAISNAHKHGQAKNIHISLLKDNDYIRMAIENDGIPFSLPQGDEKKAGMGINIMKYRSKMIYGRLEFVKTDDGHSKVICSVPFDHCKL
ncbi:MAG TPA: PAS domain S-box protein [Balneolaceae bacterium]